MDSLINLFNLIVSFFVQLIVAIIGFFIILARLAIDFVLSLGGFLHL